MIAYDELVRALDAWRTRKGLPISTTEVPMSSAPRPSASLPAAAPLATRTTAPVPAAYVPAPAPAPLAYAAPTAPRPVSTTALPTSESDVLSLDDAEVEDEQLYDNDGGDFAMAFGASSAPQPAEVGNPVGAVSGSIGGAPATEPGFYDEDEFDESAHTQAVLPEELAAQHEAAPLPPPGEHTYDTPADELVEEEEDEEAVWSKLRSRASDAPDGESDETVVGDDHKH